MMNIFNNKYNNTTKNSLELIKQTQRKIVIYNVKIDSKLKKFFKICKKIKKLTFKKTPRKITLKKPKIKKINNIKKKVIKMNKEMFTKQKKTKDKYDIEYDMGKVKKIRKKKQRKKLNFNKILRRKN